MLKKIVFSVSFVLISVCGAAQKDINNYKYIIVPKTFDFLKSEDQYQLNSLTKFLFNKYGYEAYFAGDDLPDDLKKDRCLALTSEVLKPKGGLFKTKLEIVLKDCYGTVVMMSQVGESRLKEFDKAYNQALRDAFETYKKLDYKYVSNQEVSVETKVAENIKEKSDIDTKEKESLSEKAEIMTVAENKSNDLESKENHSIMYYAQAIENGFQLVDSQPKIVMILLETTAENIFIVKGKNAIVYKEDGFWYFSENNGKLKEKKLMNIKF